MSIIQCNNLTKTFNKFTAINTMSFCIEENSITGLIGRNGAGKTTVMKLLAGYIKPTTGHIKVFGENPFNSLTVSANIFFCDDSMAYAETLNLEEILQNVSKFYPNWDMNLAKGLFDYFCLNKNQIHSKLSKGMKNTFNMIVALCSHCPLTIFDEPTTGMDASVRKDFYRALLKDYIAFPRTIIISSHLLSEIEALLEDILLIQDGKKLLHVKAQDLKEMYIQLQGNTSLLNELILNKEIIHKETLGGILKVIVKNDFTEEILEKAKVNGAEFSSVSADDICIYLTHKLKGGIDDVFNRN